MKTAIELCTDYAEISGRIRAASLAVRGTICEVEDESTASCMSLLFKTSRDDPENRDHIEDDQFEDYFERPICGECLKGIAAVRQRRELKRELGSIKRAIVAKGKATRKAVHA